MKVGDKIVCIKECIMENDSTDKRTTIGKMYTIIDGQPKCKGMKEGENWYIIDDIGHFHYFTNSWNKYFSPARKEKLLKINELSKKMIR